MTTTETVLYEINTTKLPQPAIAQILAMIILHGEMTTVDWKQINRAIKERWSLSARGRVLTMAWKIVEQARQEQVRQAAEIANDAEWLQA